jgi:hypothetical protein
LKTAGAETILFEELSPSRMMSALMGAPHDSLKDVLTRYTALMEQVKGSSLIGILTDPDKNKQEYENVKEAYESWADAAKDFRDTYGEGMVVGVVWGGIGRSEMTITDNASAKSWKYGGTANFSYAGLGDSVSIGATYDASGSADVSTIKVACGSTVLGECVRSQTDAWDQAFNGKALQAVTDIKPLDVPPLTVTSHPLSAPEFVKREKGEAEEQVAKVSKG